MDTTEGFVDTLKNEEIVIRFTHDLCFASPQSNALPHKHHPDPLFVKRTAINVPSHCELVMPSNINSAEVEPIQLFGDDLEARRLTPDLVAL